MRKDALEKITTDHRDQFDDQTPSEKIWRRISSSLFEPGKVSLWNSVPLWRAAAIMLVGLSAYLFFSKQNSALELKTLTGVGQQDFKDVESFYSAQILEKVALISHEDLFADDSFTQDLQKLEAMYTVLSEEMKKHPSEKVKDAMVLNMIVRIDLLNQQLQRLEETKRKSKSEKPTSI